MFVIGITGGIASGKSTLTEYLKPSAMAVVDADEIARDVLRPGTTAFNELVDHFGPAILDTDGTINRPVLGSRVFANQESIDFINRLTHPEIIRKIKEQLRYLASTLPPGGIILMRVPLLVETGLTDLADLCVVVTASEETRVDRLIKRRGSTALDARRVIAAQLSDSDRLKCADIVVKNDGSVDALKKAATMILEEARRRQEASIV